MMISIENFLVFTLNKMLNEFIMVYKVETTQSFFSWSKGKKDMFAALVITDFMHAFWSDESWWGIKWNTLSLTL